MHSFFKNYFGNTRYLYIKLINFDLYFPPYKYPKWNIYQLIYVNYTSFLKKIGKWGDKVTWPTIHRVNSGKIVSKYPMGTNL